MKPEDNSILCEGVQVSVTGNAPLSLQNPEKAWVVRSGRVDVFAVKAVDGELVGRRIHAFRAEEGTAIFGLSQDSLNVNYTLLASGAPGTELVEIARQSLEDFAASPDTTKLVCHYIDSWVQGLSKAFSPELRPRMLSDLNPGDTALSPQGSAHPVGAVKWARLLQGEAIAAGDSLARLSPDSLWPVAPDSWLTAEGQAMLHVVSTHEALENATFWRDFDLFSSKAMQMLARKVGEGEQQKIERLQVRAEHDGRFMKRALTSLAMALTGGKQSGEATEEQADPLLLACRIVGRHLGVQVVAPPQASEDTMSWRDPVEQIAQASRMRVRQVSLRGNWWKQDNGHLLGFLKEGAEPVALILAASGYTMHRSGAVSPVSAQVAAELSQAAYMFYVPYPARPLSALDVIRTGFSRSMIGDLVTMGIMGILGGLLQTALPVFTGIIFDTIIPSAERSNLVWVAMILFSAIVASVLFELVRSTAMLRLEGRMDATIRAATWDRILTLPPRFFRQFGTGDLSARAESIGEIKSALTGTTANAVFAAAFSVFNFGLLFHYNVNLALIATLLTLIAVVVTTLLGYLKLKSQKKLREVSGELSDVVVQLLQGVAKLRTAAAETRAYYVWSRVFSRQRILNYSSDMTSIAMAVFDSIYPLFTTVVIFSSMVSPSGVRTTRMSTGEFLAFSTAFSTVMTSMLALGNALLASLGVIPLYERARPILHTVPEVDDMKADPGALTGMLEARRITFRYEESGPTILDDVTIEARPGEFVAIVGPSGSGKSTLLRLLLGFEKPVTGGVFYDGQDLSGLNVQSVRSQIGVVLQGSKLLSGSIYTNIAGASARLTMDHAMEAVRMAGFDRDLEQMPMGLHTVLNEGATTLSGGQRQRLSIARAIIKKPRLIYFDEATSALDNRTQRIVSESIERLQATRVVIAHRLSTIINADRIYVMDRGRVVESGSYRELMQRDGLFRELAQRQMA